METLIALAIFVFSCYGLLLVTWLFYLAVMNLKRAKEMGKLHAFAKFNAVLVILIGLPPYILFNLIVGSILFLEFPKELRFTKRLQRHKAESKGWRKDLASWFCEHMLNQFDPSDRGHC